MWGAAIANIIAMTLYNGLRFGFLYYKYNLQPFTWRNGLLFMGGIAIIAAVYFIPSHANLYVDGILRSMLFVALYAFFVLRFKLSDEVEWLWQKWVMGKMLGGR
jgi:hypothetical protein